MQSEAIAKYERVKLRSSARLFQYGMLVGLDGNETDGYKPVVLFSIPEVVGNPLHFLKNFILISSQHKKTRNCFNCLIFLVGLCLSFFAVSFKFFLGWYDFSKYILDSSLLFDAFLF